MVNNFPSKLYDLNDFVFKKKKNNYKKKKNFCCFSKTTAQNRNFLVFSMSKNFLCRFRVKPGMTWWDVFLRHPALDAGSPF